MHSRAVFHSKYLAKLFQGTSSFNHHYVHTCLPYNFYRFAHALTGVKELLPIIPQKVVITPPRSYEQNFKDQHVQIRTCGNLFEKWREEKRYWLVPDGDLVFDVQYLDTRCSPHSEGESPVVLILHGSPGSYDDFTQLTSHLYQRGARIIAPCFPDVMTYKMGKFRHTPEEKCEYLKDFLTAINVPKVDLLICHSSSLFPGLMLCLEKNFPEVGALTLLNPTAFDYPRVMKPFWLTYLFTRMFEFPVGHHITLAGGRLMVMTKPQLKPGSHLDHFLAAFTLISSRIPERACLFEELMRRHFPVLLAFSENDKLIAKRSLYKMAKMMVRDSDIRRYDRTGRKESEGATNPFRKVLAFENGTHFVYKKYPDVIAEAISSFLFEHFDSQQRL